MKRILFCVIALFAIAGNVLAYEFSAVAASGQTVYYTRIDDSEVQIDNVESTATGALVIPSTVLYNGNTYYVRRIENYAFRGCTGLTMVSIPNTITSIGSVVFSGCTGLTEIVVASGNSVYDSRDNCNAIIETSSNKLVQACKNTVIPNTVTSIGWGAFRDCTELSSINIPSSVTSICGWAFYGCTGLSSINFLSSVTSISEKAFGNCTGISSAYIPSSVSSIDPTTFEGCIDLTSIVVESENSVYDSRDNCNAIIESSTNELVIGCKNTIIPNTVTSIGKSAFKGCTGLSSISIPNSITSIGNSAFSSCSGLTSITIPSSVTYFGGAAFSQCNGLRSVYYTGDLSGWCGITFDASNSNNYSNPLEAAHNLYIDNTLVTDLVIPNNVTTISAKAFRSATCLTSAIISDSTTSIGTLAFCGCSNLTSLTIGESVTSIGNSAFSGCSNLTSLTIGSAVTSIGNSAFYGCSSLTSLTVGGNVTSIGSSAFSGCRNLTSLTIGDAVTSIGGSAFWGCRKLTSVTIGRAVASIGNKAFQNDTSLMEIHLTCTTAPTLGENVFDSVPRESRVYIPCGSLDSYTQTVRWSWVYPQTRFVDGRYIYNAVSAGNGSVQIDTRPTCTDQRAEVYAVANRYYRFDHWQDGSTSNPRRITLTADATDTAFFSQRPFSVTAISEDTNMGTVSGGGLYLPNTAATFTATPNPGYYFRGWYNYYGASQDNPCTVDDVVEDFTIIGWFSPFYYTVTATSANTTMGNVTGCDHYSYPYGTTLTLTAVPNTGYQFDHWQDGNTDNPRTVTVTDDANYIAYFSAIQYTVTATSDDAVMGSVTGGGTYAYGSSATIRATANPGYRFTHWQDGNTSSQRTITVSSDTTFTAFFEVVSYTILAVCNNPDWGSVTGGGTYTMNSMVTLSAIANNGYQFSHWQDGNTENPRTIMVTGDAVYTAYFEANYTISVLSSDPNMGTAAGSGVYAEGSTVTIGATANEGYHFVQWQDGNIMNPRTIIVTADAEYIAYFAADVANEYTITVVAQNPSMGSTTGSGTFAYGTATTITAEPYEGYYFVQWNDGNTQRIRTITVTGNATYTAYFDRSNGIDDIVADQIKIYSRDSEIIVEGAENTDAIIYDIMGRIVHKGRIESPIHVNNMGVYMVKIGGRQPQKVVVR